MENCAVPDQMASPDSEKPDDLDLHCFYQRLYPVSAGQGLDMRKQLLSIQVLLLSTSGLNEAVLFSTQNICFIETVLLSTHNICFC